MDTKYICDTCVSYHTPKNKRPCNVCQWDAEIGAMTQYDPDIEEEQKKSREVASLDSLVIIGADGKPTTTSLIVAEAFGKQHKNVLRDIESLECSEDFARLNFEPRSRIVNGREYPYYEMTRDGFSFLVMGFTGKKAAEWKEMFITAFNAMEQKLLNQQPAPAFSLPVTYVEALRELANKVEETLALEHKVEVLTPKADLVDAHYAKLDRHQTVPRFARTLRGVNQQQVQATLFTMEYLYKAADGTYRVYAQYQHLFVEKRDSKTGFMTIRLTPKGCEFLVKLYREGKLVMKKGYENVWMETE